MNLDQYTSTLEKALKLGNATEHTHRPALKALVESLGESIVATNEPKRIACGAPDFIVTQKITPIGYIEAKDVGKNLDDVEEDPQLVRYRGSLRNLILTDYVDFRLYRNGEPIAQARLGTLKKNGILLSTAADKKSVLDLLTTFVHSAVPVVTSPQELAERMAYMARMLRDLIKSVFNQERNEHGELHELLQGFRKILLGDDLTPDQFADMYGQTICYGLFAARCNHTGPGFNRMVAAYDLPKTNPFLKKLFERVAGAGLDERIAWAVDDLAELLAKAEMDTILKYFGKATRREDPVVHFYETFLKAYDPDLREMRGVYYTPEPVVDYIVRSVDTILKRDFKLKKGLADDAMVSMKRPKVKGKGFETYETHRVQILDPATGTGTFLYNVVGRIRATFKGNDGMWPGYVAQHMLPRMYGFELLMAPYAVAHMKLGLQLTASGYDFASNERLRVFLTNTLEEAHEMTGLPLFTQWLAEEADKANEVKKLAPIMVVLGNPPYSGISSNTGDWIYNLMRGVDTMTQTKTESYFTVDGKPLRERKHWLNDDYVKFIRFAQWRVDQTGYGIVAFVTNHGYLDNPTFRGMRESLMQSFDDLYLLDLHGSAKKGYVDPETRERDQNVFDIMQGVSIGIFVKRPGKKADAATVRHADLYGLRKSKYEWLLKNDLTSTDWTTLKPKSPFYFFVPRSSEFSSEYEDAWKITDAMPVNSTGVLTARDHMVIAFDKNSLVNRIQQFTDPTASDESVREHFFGGRKPGGRGKYLPGDTRGWKLIAARKVLAKMKWRPLIREIAYRPFDKRFCLYTPEMVDWPRNEVMQHLLDGDNFAIQTVRQLASAPWQHALSAKTIVDDCFVSNKTRERGYCFPLYVRVDGSSSMFATKGKKQSRRVANFSVGFIEEICHKLGVKFKSDEEGDFATTIGPRQIAAYIYAILYSPSYRARYVEFLKADFPRIPITSDPEQFKFLSELGTALLEIHLGDSTIATKCAFPKQGDNVVEKIEYKDQRIYINDIQYFSNVAQHVWEYEIGAYQVCAKWLKDRKGTPLSFNDLQEYQRVVARIEHTVGIVAELEKAIPIWPIQ
ncbi:putative helicase [Paraburkholderia atlantica]|uniref:type ISP restriction/modification enzyme n=1 Tax=Paraburkholderia atlantica TaxID=2654982 RepID=UPI003D190E8E